MVQEDVLFKSDGMTDDENDDAFLNYKTSPHISKGKYVVALVIHHAASRHEHVFLHHGYARNCALLATIILSRRRDSYHTAEGVIGPLRKDTLWPSESA